MNASGSAALNCSDPKVASPVLVGYGHAVGFVPDEVREVTFQLTNGDDMIAAVRENLYAAPAEARSVTYVVGGRTQTIDLMPMSALPKGATVSADGTVSMGATAP